MTSFHLPENQDLKKICGVYIHRMNNIWLVALNICFFDISGWSVLIWLTYSTSSRTDSFFSFSDPSISLFSKTWLFIYPTSLQQTGCHIRFANGSGDRGSILGRVIPKTQKMVLDAALLNTQHYMVSIKGKVDYKSITIRRGGEEIQTYTYVLTFNKSVIPKEVKIGYCLKRVEQYILPKWIFEVIHNDGYVTH